MKLLVTGSSGFIGSAVVTHLRARGVEVHGLDNRPAPARAAHPNDHLLDLTDQPAVDALLERVQPQQVVHLAARTDLSADSVAKYHANVEGVIHLLRAVQRCGSVTRVLWTSTQLVSQVGYRQAHTTDFQPDTSYGASKVVGERVVRGLDGGGIEWAILRPTTVWGPGMSDHYVTLLRYLQMRRYFHAGGQRTPKSFSFIHNAVFQICSLLNAPAERIHGGTFYIADYEPIDMRGWVDALARELGARPPPVVPIVLARLMALAGDVLNATVAPRFKFNSFRLRNILTPYVFDTANLQAITGPLPYNMAAGVKATVDWYSASAGASEMRRAAPNQKNVEVG